MGKFEELERSLMEIKGETVQEIVNVLQSKGYGSKDPATGRGNNYKTYTVWSNVYGNGIIVETEDGTTHVDNLSTEETLMALSAVLRALPR